MTMTLGCIHGRFQPFHNGHFEYLLAASRYCDRLVIGITQFDPEIADDGSPPHRMAESDNPFSYWERLQIIRRVIERSPLAGREVEIVPFPIHQPSNIGRFVDRTSTMFTTIYDRWNVEKIRRLKEQGYRVRVLWRRRIKEIEGKQVRLAMRHDMQLFKRLVPEGGFEAVVEIIQGWPKT
ncbi:adenylyltransferase/cytidyltransferase family protein [Bradyrhizobium sp. IC3195]|uniref:adenylyltransferase/cytidyltransferase family protein n=1 Tax=Bradyrhizobium sp. IC3195 TaxID=2793804 RepID=UPI001CD37AC5|nr:adenylyltransferase/cytidyltransferase family protein [Bradyrhizobium sp. IC3195]MCA1473353.1 adenylyltransferase/cytidyltransferase family protein [Bradyrhizobium sp. IC3195]